MIAGPKDHLCKILKALIDYHNRAVIDLRIGRGSVVLDAGINRDNNFRHLVV